MSSIFNTFLAGKNTKYRATIIHKDKTLVKGRITEVEPSEDEDKIFDCYFWRQEMNRMNIGQTFKTGVSAYIITSPEWISTTDFPKDSRVKIEQQANGTYTEVGEFDFVYAEDIGGLGYLVKVALNQVI